MCTTTSRCGVVRQLVEGLMGMCRAAGELRSALEVRAAAAAAGAAVGADAGADAGAEAGAEEGINVQL